MPSDVDRHRDRPDSLGRPGRSLEPESSGRTTARKDVSGCAARSQIEYTLAQRGAERLWELLHTEALRPRARRADGQPGRSRGQGGPARRSTSRGWQVAADANLAGQMYPDQSLYPCNSVPHVVKRINHALQRADQIQHAEGKNGDRLVRADRRRRRGRLRRPAQRLRAHEGHDRGRRRRRPLRGPARLREEVRAHGRQGPGPDLAVHPDADRRPARRRRLDVPTLIVARTDANSAQLLTSDIDERDRPFLTGERTPEGFFRLQRRPRRGHRPRARLRAVRRPDLVRDLRAEPRRGQALRRGDPRAASRASCWPTTARPRSTGRRSSTTRRSPASSASSARWATSSSSSRWPASTPSTTACSSWRGPTARRA